MEQIASRDVDCWLRLVAYAESVSFHTVETAGSKARKPIGEPLDPATRARLREYVRAATWRGAMRELRVDAVTIRHALACHNIHVSTSRAIRLALDLAGVEEPQS